MNPQVLALLVSDPCGTFALPQRKENLMAKVFEFSDGFDAVAFHTERMSRPDFDEYYEEEEMYFDEVTALEA